MAGLSSAGSSSTSSGFIQNARIAPGTLVQFVAAAYPGSDGLACVTADVSWQSSSPSVAAIVTQGPNAGLARGLSAETTTVAATVGAITSTAIVTVE